MAHRPRTAGFGSDDTILCREELVDQYEFFFTDNPFGLITTFTEQDKKDIVEYLKILK
jgi:hypothetical protein